MTVPLAYGQKTHRQDQQDRLKQQSVRFAGLTSHAKRRFLKRLRASSNQGISKTQSETQYRLEETATRWLPDCQGHAFRALFGFPRSVTEKGS